MMGNFSFGDYFKKEAITYAWDFLTQEMNLPKDKMYASVFREDDEAYDIWHNDIGLPKERIIRLGETDNFWQMGDIGPCGPCSEIYLDQGDSIVGCGKKDCAPGCSCDRFLEVWNLVFMQYDRQADGTDKLLKQTGVDTGMGLERLCVVVQKKDSVFETDLFEPILKKIEELSGLKYEKQDQKVKASFHVLADHIRSSALIIADGGSPSNEGRGYVLRKIIRRAALFSEKLSKNNIFPSLVDPLIEKLGPIYPELEINREKIKKILSSEIERFAANLLRGQAILETYFEKDEKTHTITGEQAFRLYDTFGFPLELIRIIANERGFVVDVTGFEGHMLEQQKRSGKKGKHEETSVEFPETLTTEFTGYTQTETSAPIIALIADKNNNLVDHVEKGTECWVMCSQSPFYVERGGQVSDKGWIVIDGYKTEILEIKNFNMTIGTKILASEAMNVGMVIEQVVDKEVRLDTMKNHTATHLLQAALIELFGKQIKQSGSLVEPDYLRFDFTYHENLSPEDVKRVEDLVNKKIMENIPVTTSISSYKEATSRGVIAFFGDKYNPENVRVVEVPGFSAELCGGTHVNATGDIGAFKITDVSALSAGNRRIFAVTGPKALELFQESYRTVKTLSQEFKVQPHEVLNSVEKQKEQLKSLQTEIKSLKKKIVATQLPTWLAQVESVNEIPFLFLELEETPGDELKELAQQMQRQKPALYFLISSTDEKSAFIASLAPELSEKVDLKQFQTWIREELGLRGGGNKVALQGGGPRLEKTWAEQIKNWLKKS
jgi:alanyl-tRNA synthetase